MFDLSRLRLLRELAHHGTMTAVAAAHGLTSSAVSQQLAILEHEARVPLLERIGRRVRLTQDGLRLVAHAETILAAVEAAALDLKAGDATPRGELHVGCFPSYTQARLLPAAIQLQKRHAGLKVLIHDLQPADAIDAVRHGRCQMAITFAFNLVPRPDADGLQSRLLMDEPVLLALPARLKASKNPIDLKRLAGEDWIVGSRQSDDLELAERACALAGVTPRIAHTIDDYNLLMHMVAEGFGVGFVPELALQFPSAKSAVFRRSAGAPVRRHIYGLTRRATAASPALQALLTELEKAR